mmetsp:Transcript_21719/g.36543  ORF Transcript_21719/g.36543 Transcript_21719/m.36543 type:complete len:330 (+) Transcript_21719:600-1589(+)
MIFPSTLCLCFACIHVEIVCVCVCMCPLVLNYFLNFSAPVTTRDTAVLLELLENCYVPLTELLTRFEGSAPERLDRLRTFVVESDVLSFFLTSAEADAERELILRNVQDVMLPYQEEVVQLTQVLRHNLQSRQRELLRLLVKPSLADFLRNPDTFAVLCDWFASNRELESIHWLYFYKSAKDYSALTSRHLMSQRASQIQKKYLLGPDCSCPVVLPPGVHEKVSERIDLDEVAPGLFSEALSHTLSILKDDFTEMFLEEKHFQFLQVELLAVESKLNVLSGGGGVTSTLSLLRTDVDGDVSLGIKVDAIASSNSVATGDDTVCRMSFWN